MMSSSDDDFQPRTASRRIKATKRTSLATPASSLCKARLISSATKSSACTGEAVAVAEHQPAHGSPQKATDPGTCSKQAPSVLPAAGLAGGGNAVATQQQPASSIEACPICGLELSSVSDTVAGRAAHVNACLDVPAVPPALPAAEAEVADADLNSAVDLTAEAHDFCDDFGAHDSFDDSNSGIQEWLHGIGAADVADSFVAADIDLSVLPHLTDHDLEELGVADIELRFKILEAAAGTAAAGTNPEADAGLPALDCHGFTTEQSLLPHQPEAGDIAAIPHAGQRWSDDGMQAEGCDEQCYADPCDDLDMYEHLAPEDEQHPRENQQGQQHHQQQHEVQADLLDGYVCLDDGVAADGDEHSLQWPDAGMLQQGHGEGDHSAHQGWQQQQRQQQQSQHTMLSCQEHQNQQLHISAGQQQQQLLQVHQGQPHRLMQAANQQDSFPWYRQQQQAQEQQLGVMACQPLQPSNQAKREQGQQAQGARSTGTSSDRAAQLAGRCQQSSITGWTVQQQPPLQQQQQQAPDAKEQWRKLFKRPQQALGSHKPAPAAPRQMRISSEGQLIAAPPQVPAAAAVAPARGRTRLPAAAAAAVSPPALPQDPSSSLPNWWAAWQRLPGTNIPVDCFGRASHSVSGQHRAWILTHFHADHYMGLSKSFNKGVIICSPITAALVQLKLRVPRDRLVTLELGRELTVEGTRLQFIDANHCPGAVMVVAHPPRGAPPVLHTGDARLTAEATRNQPELQALVGRAMLVLDTTYADPTYCFPPQQNVLDWVLRAVKAEMFNPRCLFLFGTYTIGKERLFLHVAAALRCKVYVAAAKRSIMSCIDLPAELSELLTTNHLEANIHAVPMRQVTLEAMESLLLRYKGRYTAVVGFQPTGWSHAGGSRGQRSTAGGAVAGPSRSSISIKPTRRRHQRGTVVLYKVPYSEHSSCDELRDFVSWFRPLHIIPSVNNDRGPKLRQMMAAITAPSQASGPMDAFARREQQQ